MLWFKVLTMQMRANVWKEVRWPMMYTSEMLWLKIRLILVPFIGTIRVTIQFTQTGTSL